ncbi:MAG TPA: VWA domain-containing protein, partial [Pseudonocardiaceae bacterium]|nr:VWA domain-containing protein [Pseudonocardiaceae bacterium]
ADSVAASLAVEPDAVAPDAVAPDAEGGTFALTVLPPVSGAPPRPRDVVLVLDRSGSMGGWKIAAARRAAARIVDTLTAADRFAVLAFDHEVAHPEQLPRGLVAANDRNRFRAVTHLSAMTARGGTEMLAPLQEAAGLLADGGRDLVLVLVTDGQVGNEDQILHALAPRLGSIRVHTVGVDSAVNAAFLRRLADASGGRCELVESEDRLDDAMRAIHHRIAAPLVTDLTVTGDGVAADTIAPARLPDLFPGAAVLVSGRCSGTDAVRVSGRLADGTPWGTTVSAVRGDNAGLAATWARARIRDLEDRYVTARSVAPDLEREIVAVSLRYRVLSRFTAFVAVDQRVVTEGGQRHQVVQPVDLPHGWNSNEVAVAASAPRPLAGMPLRFSAATASGRPVADATRMERAPRASAGSASVAPRPASLVPSSVEAFVTHALRRLAELAGRPEPERSSWLAKLAADIRRRLADFRADGLPERGVRVLTDLADALEQPGDLADRWRRAETTLRALTDRRSGAFWAR